MAIIPPQNYIAIYGHDLSSTPNTDKDAEGFLNISLPV